MHRVHWKLLLVDHLFGSALVNAAINGLIGWLLYGMKTTRVPLWGVQGMAADLLATGFLLPFLYCIIATPTLRRTMRDGDVPPLSAGFRLAGPLSALPARARMRGVVLGVAASVSAVPLTLIVLAACGMESLSGPQFTFLKAAWAAGLAALVGPIIALAAFAEQHVPAPAAEP
jgi:hypothetical protein